MSRVCGDIHKSHAFAMSRMNASMAGVSLLVLVFSLWMLGIAGCATVKPSVSTQTVEPNEYRIGPEDVLEISVWNEENLKRTVVVLPDGNISFPMAGVLSAAGKTVPELRNELAKGLSRFVHDPQVFVSVEKTSGLRIYVIGEVQKPGQYMIGRYVDVLQALSLAGGLTPYANTDEIQIVRREGNKKVVYRFDYGAIRDGKGLGQNIMLRGDDVVLVP